MANNSSSFEDVYNSHPLCFMSVSSFDPYDPVRPDGVNLAWTVLATINGLTALPTACVNVLIIWTVFSDENLRSSPFNVLLGELALTDMFVGLIVSPMHSGLLGCFINYCHSPCQFTAYGIALIICSGITLVTLALACAERYLAIEHPNLYNRIVTGKRAQKVAVISWLSTLVYLTSSTILLNNFHPSLTKVPFMSLGAVCVGIILFCCSKVQLTAYRQRRTIDMQKQTVVSQNTMQSEESEEQTRRHKRELKQVFTMTVLVIASVLFITPSLFVAAVELMTSQVAEFRYLVGPIGGTLLGIQSLVNPGILAFRLSYIRQGIKNKLTFLMSRFPFRNN